MKIIYYENKCIGCGACVLAAPEFWILSTKTGKAELIDGQLKKDSYQTNVFQNDIELANKSKLSCPTKAITLL